jgi:hypothetical protein
VPDSDRIMNWDQAQALMSRVEQMAGGSIDAYAAETPEDVQQILKPTPSERNYEETGLRVEEDPEEVASAAPDVMAYNPNLDFGETDMSADDVFDPEGLAVGVLNAMRSTGALAPDAIQGYAFHACSVDCGELDQVVDGFMEVEDGLPNIEVVLDSGKYQMQQGAESPIQLVDAVKNRTYRKGLPELKDLDPLKLWILVYDSLKPANQPLGYIYDGWVYLQEKEGHVK